MGSSLLTAFVENYTSRQSHGRKHMQWRKAEMSKQRMSQDISVQFHFVGPPQTSLCLSTVNINMSNTSFQMDFQLTVISIELILFLK